SDPDQVIQVGQKTEAGQEILNEVSSFLQNKVSETLPEPPISQTRVESKHKAAPVRELVAIGASNSHVVSRKKIEEPEREFIPLGGYKSAEATKRESTQTVFSYKKSEVKEISLTVEKPSIEDLLLEYVRKSNGEIDLTRCSSELNTSNEEIEKALESLGNKGRIKIELR
ncbi:MAG: hypothetical protein GX638_12140, partial [Crenarchaeota archaeon]|nr:hypothetical protein [Thermoproteota archaeon]